MGHIVYGAAATAVLASRDSLQVSGPADVGALIITAVLLVGGGVVVFLLSRDRNRTRR